MRQDNTLSALYTLLTKSLYSLRCPSVWRKMNRHRAANMCVHVKDYTQERSPTRFSPVTRAVSSVAKLPHD